MKSQSPHAEPKADPADVEGGVAVVPSGGSEPKKKGSIDPKTGKKKEKRGSIDKKKKAKKEKTSTTKKYNDQGHTGMLNALALQFPCINKSFNAVYSSFNAFHTGGDGFKQTLEVGKLQDVLHSLCPGKEFTDEEVEKLFGEADLDKDGVLTFREFLISIAMGYYLTETESTDEHFRAVQKGFLVRPSSLALTGLATANSLTPPDFL